MQSFPTITIEMNDTLYLETPARARKVMKINSPAQTPGSPNIGPTSSRKIEENSPAST